MSALNTRLTCENDFDRAFEMAERLVQYELKMKWRPDLMTQGMANDTMAAIVQAKNFIKFIHRSGYLLPDVQRWVEELVAEDEAERAKLRANEQPFEPSKVLVNPPRPATDEDYAPGGMLDFLTGPNAEAKAA